MKSTLPPLPGARRRGSPAASGDARITLNTSLEHAFSDMYPALQSMARSRLWREQAAVSTGTLVHELYLSMRNQPQGLLFPTQQHFLAYAARAMRSLLVDMARERRAQKRSAPMGSLTEGLNVGDISGGTPEQLVALSEAIERLGRLDERLMQVADMRAVLGLEVAEIAQALHVSEPTVKRDWQRARAFLADALGLAA